MPFDGVDHRNATLIHPYGYHSGAVATGQVLSSSLAAAYFVSRYEAGNIGTQPYYVGVHISSNTWFDVARWRRFIPSHATGVVVEALARQASVSDDGQFHHRVTVNETIATDTGADTVESFDLQSIDSADPGRDSSSVVRADRAGWHPKRFVFFVELSAVSSRLPSSDVVITAEAYAEDSEGLEVPYFPMLYSAWWVSLG